MQLLLPVNEVYKVNVFTGVCLSMGGMCGRGHAWQEACVAGDMDGMGHAWQEVGMVGGVWGRGGACMAGGHAWLGACMAEGVYGGEGGMCSRRGHVWQGSVHDRRDGHCSGWYIFYWNAFFFFDIFIYSVSNFLKVITRAPKSYDCFEFQVVFSQGFKILWDKQIKDCRAYKTIVKF